MKKTYHYAPETLVFTSISEAQKHPFKPNEYLKSDYCTFTAPPEFTEHETAIFEIENDAWEIVPDYRGIALYDKTSGESVTITEPNQTPDQINATTIAPPDAISTFKNGKWATDNAKKTAAEALARRVLLDALKQKAIDALDASDKTIVRCAEKNIRVPADWAIYRDDLRKIITNASEDTFALNALAAGALPDLPPHPDFPAGT